MTKKTKRATHRPRRRWVQFVLYLVGSMIAYSVLSAVGATASPLWLYATLWAAVIIGVRWLLRYDSAATFATSRTKAMLADYGAVGAVFATLVLAPAGPVFADAAAVSGGVILAVVGCFAVGRSLRQQYPLSGPTSSSRAQSNRRGLHRGHDPLPLWVRLPLGPVPWPTPVSPAPDSSLSVASGCSPSPTALGWRSNTAELRSPSSEPLRV